MFKFACTASIEYKERVPAYIFDTCMCTVNILQEDSCRKHKLNFKLICCNLFHLDQPDNWLDAEDCGMLRTYDARGDLNDLSCAEKLPYLCMKKGKIV